MAFANKLNVKAAKYISYNCYGLNSITLDSKVDLCLFYYSEATMSGPEWEENMTKVMDLLQRQMEGGYSMVIVDCDAGKPYKLEKAYIEH